MTDVPIQVSGERRLELLKSGSKHAFAYFNISDENQIRAATVVPDAEKQFVAYLLNYESVCLSEDKDETIKGLAPDLVSLLTPTELKSPSSPLVLTLTGGRSITCQLLFFSHSNIAVREGTDPVTTYNGLVVKLINVSEVVSVSEFGAHEDEVSFLQINGSMQRFAVAVNDYMEIQPVFKDLAPPEILAGFEITDLYDVDSVSGTMTLTPDAGRFSFSVSPQIWMNLSSNGQTTSAIVVGSEVQSIQDGTVETWESNAPIYGLYFDAMMNINGAFRVGAWTSISKYTPGWEGWQLSSICVNSTLLGVGAVVSYAFHLPDASGYLGGFPQILASVGVRHYQTTASVSYTGYSSFNGGDMNYDAGIVATKEVAGYEPVVGAGYSDAFRITRTLFINCSVNAQYVFVDKREFTLEFNGMESKYVTTSTFLSTPAFSMGVGIGLLVVL